jgi:hypothetical protein
MIFFIYHYIINGRIIHIIRQCPAKTNNLAINFCYDNMCARLKNAIYIIFIMTCPPIRVINFFHILNIACIKSVCIIYFHINHPLFTLLNYYPYITVKNKKGIILVTLNCLVTKLFLIKNYCACTSNDISILPLVAFE